MVGGGLPGPGPAGGPGLLRRIANSAVWLPTQVDKYVTFPALNFVANRLPFVWNRTPPIIGNSLAERNGVLRWVADAGLAYGAPVAGALLGVEFGTDVGIGSKIVGLYMGNQLLAAAATIGGGALLVEGAGRAYDVATIAAPLPPGPVPRISYIAVPFALFAAAVLGVASLGYKHPVGVRSVSVGDEARTVKELTLEELKQMGVVTTGDLAAKGYVTGDAITAIQNRLGGLETTVTNVEKAAIAAGPPLSTGEVQTIVQKYVTNILTPQLEETYGVKLSAEQRKVVVGLVQNYVAGQGFATTGDVSALQTQLEGATLNLKSLEEAVRGIQKPTPTPKPTPQLGLGQYSLYRVPATVLMSVAQRDVNGLAGALGLTVPTLQARLDGNNKNYELVLLQVSDAGVRMIQEDEFGKWRAFDFKPENLSPGQLTKYFSKSLTVEEHGKVSGVRK